MLSRRDLLATLWSLALALLLWPFGVKLPRPGRRKIPVNLARFGVPRFTRDVSSLRVWHMDIRGVLSANSMNAMRDEIAARFTAELFKAIDDAKSQTIS